MACVFAQIADRYLDVIDSEAAWAWERESIQTLLEVVRDYMNDAHDNVSTAHQMALGLSKEERERLIGE